MNLFTAPDPIRKSHQKRPVSPLFNTYVLLTFTFLFGSCSSGSIKEKINKTGDVAGQAIGEFTSGVTTGVEKAIEPEIVISDSLAKYGLAFGKSILTADTTDGENVLTIYVIYNADFNGSLTAKAFDNKGLEMGRARVPAVGKKDEAGYLEFHFDKRTDLDNDSRITIE